MRLPFVLQEKLNKRKKARYSHPSDEEEGEPEPASSSADGALELMKARHEKQDARWKERDALAQKKEERAVERHDMDKAAHQMGMQVYGAILDYLK